MKNILIKSIVFVFLISITCISSAFKISKHKEILKAKTSVCSVGNNVEADTITNYSININGKQDLVTIKTDSLTVQTTESIANQSIGSNSIEINGQGNTVAISQENKNDKVVVSQNGNNNSVNISQSSHQP
ncbi:curlin repeat-containing protein [Aquipluma nitroreducens]|uniref:curlin repeat-containing protein n=1 Tax=Aquipluma nitroreducens TaxID=2010828 RepID=UPI00296EA705|nr:curlin repeat-containing protein [Aquipluma nitroreducens]